MDTRNLQQKDYISSLYPTDQQNHQQDGQQQSMSMFQYNSLSPSHQPSMGMQQGTPQSINPQLTMEMLGSMMQIQGIESQTTSPTSPQPFNPQSMLEQQFKLTQLQQLQQLQNHIFQQQVKSLQFTI